MRRFTGGLQMKESILKSVKWKSLSENYKIRGEKFHEFMICQVEEVNYKTDKIWKTKMFILKFAKWDKYI